MITQITFFNQPIVAMLKFVFLGGVVSVEVNSLSCAAVVLTPSHPCNAETEHVGSSPCRQALLARGGGGGGIMVSCVVVVRRAIDPRTPCNAGTERIAP